MKRILALAACFSFVSPIARLGAADKSTVDDRISDLVRMKLATDADVKGGALDVMVKDGVVIIKGRVDSDRGKEKATKLTKKVKGVKSVDNELSVGPPTA